LFPWKASKWFWSSFRKPRKASMPFGNDFRKPRRITFPFRSDLKDPETMPISSRKGFRLPKMASKRDRYRSRNLREARIWCRHGKLARLGVRGDAPLLGGLLGGTGVPPTQSCVTLSTPEFLRNTHASVRTEAPNHLEQAALCQPPCKWRINC
jgi:hypothetical protein